MNVYEKLNAVRKTLAEANIKKSGKNNYSGYDYFELGDFLVPIQKFCSSVGLATLVSFTEDIATMRIVNTEKPDEYVEFTSPMSKAELKGCHPVQNIGAVETYQRRYLYLTAFEITEHDGLEPTTGKEEPQYASEAQRKEILRLAGEFGDATPEGKRLMAYLADNGLTWEKANATIASARKVLEDKRK